MSTPFVWLLLLKPEALNWRELWPIKGTATTSQLHPNVTIQEFRLHVAGHVLAVVTVA